MGEKMMEGAAVPPIEGRLDSPEARAEMAEVVAKLNAIDAELEDVQHSLSKWGVPSHKEDILDVRHKLHGMHHYYEDTLVQQS